MFAARLTKLISADHLNGPDKGNSCVERTRQRLIGKSRQSASSSQRNLDLAYFTLFQAQNQAVRVPLGNYPLIGYAVNVLGRLRRGFGHGTSKNQ
jgi:hypothetical protein